MTAEGVFPKSDGDVLYASEVNSFQESRKVIAFGSITVQTTTTAFDTDYADIAFSAGDLNTTDQLVLDVVFDTGNTGTALSLSVRPDIRDVTSTGSFTEVGASSDGSGNSGKLRASYIIRQSSTNDILESVVSSIAHTTSTGFGVDGASVDTNDANVLATAFTLRLNAKFSTSASSSAKVYYTLYRDVVTP